MALVFQLMLELLQLLLALAGSSAGFSINRRGGWPVGRRPRDLLRSASAFTTGVFASLVMLVSVHSGLDAARTASSRLSTALTIHSGGGGGCARLDQPGPERRRRSAG